MDFPSPDQESSMFYFPTLDENKVGSEREQSVKIIERISNLFRPSSASTSRCNAQMQHTQNGEGQVERNADDQAAIAEVELQQAIIGLENGKLKITETEEIGRTTSSLMDYKKSQFIRYWMPDSSGSDCYDCHEKFNTFRRKHHCRLCGQIFCKNCASRQVNGVELGYYGVLRLCNFCADQMDARTKEGRGDSKVKPFLADIHQSAESVVGNGANFEQPSASQKARLFNMHPSSAELGFDQPICFNKNESEDAFSRRKAQSGQMFSSSNKNEQQIEQMFEVKIDRLLETLLIKENLEIGIWKDLLRKLSSKVADRIVCLALENAATENVPLDFMHIKKLHMNVDPCFEIIDGVAFSNSLAHSGMPVAIKNVSLMLLSGTISYERMLEKFSSIEPIIQQESQFLRIQSDRIVSAHISLLVSENGMPLTVQDWLMKESISTLANVKKSVMRRISEATGADILSSLDAHFLHPKLGFVPEFYQREFLTCNGTRKRIILLEYCTGNFGPTILLKGRNLQELDSAKRILRFLVLTRYSSKLETVFLSLFNSQPKDLAQKSMNTADTFPCHICELNQRSLGWRELVDDDQQAQAKANHPSWVFLRSFAQTQLSNSPAIHFSPPFLETPLGRQSSLISHFKQPLFRFMLPTDLSKFREMDERKKHEFETLELEEEEAKAKNNNLTHPLLHSNSLEKVLSDSSWTNFRSSSALHFRRKAEMNRRAREQKMVKVKDLLFESEEEQQLRCLTQADVLNPYNHQGLFFLFCANSRKAQNTSKFCMGPYVLNKIFYDKHKDISLGKFLQNYCFNAEYRCKGCDRPMQEHLRRIVHRNARLEITTQTVAASSSRTNTSAIISPFGAVLGGLGSDGGDFGGSCFPQDELPSAIPNNNCQQMICWLRCNSCSANSSIAQMPDAFFHLSFAKFVNYLTNGTHWVSPFPSSVDLRQCLHCTFHSHSHLFALGNFVTCFTVSPVYPLNIVLSPIPCAIDTTATDQNEELTAEKSVVLLRDTLDGKGPDIGSIIAHALFSEEYANKKALPSAQSADWLEVTHLEENVHYTIKVHYAEQFEQFRNLIFANGEEKYIQSLAHSSPWYPQGGKSGASFFRTDDERFVLKTLSRFELDYFKKCAQKYIDYVSVAGLEHRLTALCKVFGAYSISYANRQTGQSLKNDYLVMEYIFYKKDIKQIWDLKGSLRNRFASTKSSSNLAADSPSSSVLLDENYIQNLWRNQIYLTAHSKAALTQAVVNDSNFLASQGIMDYSLLAGISRGQEDEIIIGIVDYMRTFTLDKKVESLVKTALPISNSPTVISPEQYCKRFYEAIDGYFAVAPDQWTSESSFY